MKKNILDVANTVLAAGITFSVVSSTPIVTCQDNFLPQNAYYAEANNLGISNSSYNYLKSNVYYGQKLSKIENEAQELFGNMRDATKEELQSVNDYISSISKETGVDFWSLC